MYFFVDAGLHREPTQHRFVRSLSPRMQQSLGGRAFHGGDETTEREYDRLRALAHKEADRRNDCFKRSHEAYDKGDHAGAKAYSQQGKTHSAKMEDYNRQAAEFIFRANNVAGEVHADAIDLHGLYVEEAERILEKRIRADQAAGQTHLHAIVGQGHHSVGHVQKLKPKVEELCRELGLRYNTEENAGRIYINLQGGEPHGPGHYDSHAGHKPYRHSRPSRLSETPQPPPQPPPQHVEPSMPSEPEKTGGLFRRMLHKLKVISSIL